MTALRYHMGSAEEDWAERRGMGLHEIIEVLLGADAASQPEDRSGHVLRIELHEVLGATPEIARAAQKIVHLEGVFRLDAQLSEIERGVAVLHVVRIQI